MKKIIIIIASVFVLFMGAAVAIPIIFKDDIKAAIDAEIAKSVNADVYFDPEKLGLSLLSNFPSITVSMEELGIIGRDEFAEDVLLAVEKFELEVNLYHLLFGDNIRISGITLTRPHIFIKVLENGKANYDIAVESETVEQDTAVTSSTMAISIDHWEIIEGKLRYDDQSIPYVMNLEGLNHIGSGDFTLDVLDMDTRTTIEKVDVMFDGVEYLSNKKLDLDMILNMDLPAMKFTFKDNTLKVNDFAVNFDGSFSMPDEGYEMDIGFSSSDNKFKSLLSLVPGVFKEGFEDIKTQGNLAFSGKVKGVYSEQQMPAFHLNLKVDEAMFRYPDLPKAVKDINIDLILDNKDGNIDHTLIDIKKFDMDFGGNPVTAVAKIEGLSRAAIQADIHAKLDLAALNTTFPVEGLDMKGIYNLDLVADGVYDSLQGKFPSITADMSLKEGYFKYADYPIPLEKVNFVSTVKNEGGSMAGTLIQVKQLGMLLDGEEFTGDLTLKDLENYQWDAHINGNLNLEKLTRLFPLDSMQLSGLIAANIASKGKMSDLEAGRYDKIATSGTVDVRDFSFVSEVDFPQGIKIDQATTEFDAEKIKLSSFKGKLGKSDLQLTGNISNYLNYLFKEGALIKGKMTFNSNKFDINEWMVTEGEVSEDTATYETEVVAIPKNIDFQLSANIKEVDYDNMKLKNVKGNVLIREGMVILDKVNFNTLGGAFAVNGTYDTRDTDRPAFDFDLDVANVSIQQSYMTFNTVKAFAPIAQFVNGNFSTNFALNGELGQDMMPKLGTITGSGLVNIVEAVLEKNNITNGIAGLTNLDKVNNVVAIKDLLLKTEIKDGKLNVKPFNIKLGNFNTLVSGNTGLDGSLDYELEMDIPAGSYGAKFNALVSSVTGGGNTSQNIKLPITLTQNFTDPKFVLGHAFSKDNLKEQVTETAKEKLLQQITDNKGKVIKDPAVSKLVDSSSVVDTKAQLKAREDSVKKALAEQAKAKQDSLKKMADQTKKKAEDKIKNLLKFNKKN